MSDRYEMDADQLLDGARFVFPPPVEPSSELRELASTLRQTYLALVAEGFTEPQALKILGQMLAANSGEK